MTFADFSKHLFKIEATPKRLEITDLLSELIKQTDPEEVEKAVNLSLGQLAPLYKDIDFNMAEKMMIKAVAAATDVNIQNVINEFKRNGDLGETVKNIKEQRAKSKEQRANNSVVKVYARLLEIAQDSGENSQERKIEKTADLLRGLDPLSAKYAVRIILGNLRLGFSDRTVLDALSKIVAGDKSARRKLEEIYNVRPDIGWMAKQTRNSQLATRNFTTKPELGIPILPALCQRLEGTEEIVEKMCRPLGRASSIEESGGAVAAEPKWDGQRIQAHVNLKDKPQIQLFTRGLENVASMFPDLIIALSRVANCQLPVASCILDGEVVAFDPKTNKILPFQTMITRKRKYGVQEQILNVPVKYMVFDIMYLNGKSLMNEPFSFRRITLEKLFPPNNQQLTTNNLSLAPQIVSDNPDKIRDFLKTQISLGLEGIVAKRLDSPYSPGRTGFSWVKLKWEGKAKSGGLVDTIDCVVMGIYAGQGKRAGFGAGAFLVGIADSSSSKFKVQNSKFVTISKIGTGLSDEQWKELRAKGQGLRAKVKPKEYDVPKQLIPDTWLEPKIVVEIQADNITVSPLHTARFALRFPRLVRYRDDKSPQQATTVGEVRKLYKMQG